MNYLLGTFHDFMPCIICEVAIEPSLGKVVSFLPCSNITNAEHSSYADGVVGTISGGYGSRYDCSTFAIAICDDCIEKYIGKKIIKSSKGLSPWTPQEEIERLIETWHMSKSPRGTLASFLQLSDKEYAEFVELKLSSDEVWKLYNERKT